MAGVLVLFAIQIWDVVRFFPNYLFYGAQYGERFIGEFYGPAVLHAQGRAEVWRVIEAIRARDPEAQILVADNNMFDANGETFVPFTKRDPNVRYRYALVDRLYATHFHFPERDAYNAYLAKHYKVAFTTEFPTGVWVYRVLKFIPREDAGSPALPERGLARRRGTRDPASARGINCRSCVRPGTPPRIPPARPSSSDTCAASSGGSRSR